MSQLFDQDCPYLHNHHEHVEDCTTRNCLHSGLHCVIQSCLFSFPWHRLCAGNCILRSSSNHKLLLPERDQRPFPAPLLHIATYSHMATHITQQYTTTQIYSHLATYSHIATQPFSYIQPHSHTTIQPHIHTTIPLHKATKPFSYIQPHSHSSTQPFSHVVTHILLLQYVYIISHFPILTDEFIYSLSICSPPL